MPKQRRRQQRSQNAPAHKKQKKASEDDFFEAASEDEDILSTDEDEGEYDVKANGATELQEETQDTETADEKRLRVAKAYLDEIRASTKHLDENGDGGDDDYDVDQDAKRREALGARDSLVADLLQQAQLEESGRVQRQMAARVVEPTTLSEGKRVGRRHRLSVTAVALTEDDSKGFSASKDGLIVRWDVETGSSDVFKWPRADSSESSASYVNGMVSGGKWKKQKGSRNVQSLAVSSDGRYLATGGLDRLIHLWDARTLEHIQAFSGHKGAISSLVFRQGSQQLMSASFDRTIKLWSVEDRSYMDTLYGHHSEVITIDCLRQERLLSAGRDRTCRIWKIPDETQLLYRGHAASMECCCFLTNTEFLSGSDDGSVTLWSAMKKKPVQIMKNAHGILKDNNLLEDSNKVNGNGEINHNEDSQAVQRKCGVESWVSSVAVCRGSDLAASGAGDGNIRLWALGDNNRHLRALHSLPAKGFVNSIAFAKSGRFLLAGIGQEPRLGRWGRNARARNGVIMHTVIPM